MKFKEKWTLLMNYEKKEKLTDKQFRKILTFSSDKEALIRSEVARLLVNFNNESSKKTLLKLAGDKDSLVRTEAYDSLCIFSDKDVESFLKSSILKEDEELACSYAILSWADVVNSIYDDVKEKMILLNENKKNFKFIKSEHCLLSYYYAQYIFGDKEVLNSMFDLLKSTDYHIRCATINILGEIVDRDNIDIIRQTMLQLCTEEKAIAVKASAQKLFDDLINF